MCHNDNLQWQIFYLICQSLASYDGWFSRIVKLTTIVKSTKRIRKALSRTRATSCHSVLFLATSLFASFSFCTSSSMFLMSLSNSSDVLRVYTVGSSVLVVLVPTSDKVMSSPSDMVIRFGCSEILVPPFAYLFSEYFESRVVLPADDCLESVVFYARKIKHKTVNSDTQYLWCL